MRLKRVVFAVLISLSAMTLAVESQAKDNLTVGVCTLVEQRSSGKENGEYIGPLEAAESYLVGVEHRNLDGGKSTSISLLQTPKYGVVANPPSAFKGYYFYKPHAGYFGFDSVIFLIEIGGCRLRLVQQIHVVRVVPGTDGYDPYEDKKYCPNGPVWKVNVETRVP